MKQYENWKAGGQYYFYKDIANQNIISRFRMATQDTLEFLGHETLSMLIPGFRAKLDLSKFGIIGVKNKKIPMVLHYWEEDVTDPQLTALRSIISEFKSISHSKGIIPILIYIPTATQVYAELYSAESNNQFINRVKNTKGNPSLDALMMIAGQLDLDLLNLLPVFKSEASKGRILYHSFDTHWNREGRQTAASFIASYLKNEGTMH
jgi:hypothetical protein